MKVFFMAVIMLLLTVSSVGYAGVSEGALKEKTENVLLPEEMESENMIKLQIKIGNEVFSAKLYDNASTKELTERLPITLEMSDLNDNEKYYYLDSPLTTDSKRVDMIHAGDIMLYGSDCLVLFYDNFSSPYSYTRLGYVEGADKLSETLGDGDVSVTFRVE